MTKGRDNSGTEVASSFFSFEEYPSLFVSQPTAALITLPYTHQRLSTDFLESTRQYPDSTELVCLGC